MIMQKQVFIIKWVLLFGFYDKNFLYYTYTKIVDKHFLF